MNNKENIKVILTLNDNDATIVLFNNVDNEPNILFQKDYELKNGAIKKGYICDMEEVCNAIRSLINAASAFTKLKIKSAYVSFSTHDITINSIDMGEIELEDGIFDYIIWDKILKSMDVQQIFEKYIFDIGFKSWIIDGKEYKSIEGQKIAGKKLVVKVLAYQINKVLYSQYKILFDKVGIKILHLKPVVSDFVRLSSSIKDTHNELFVSINDNTLTITRTSGKNLKNFIQTEELGLNCLYKEIADSTNLNVDFVKSIMNTIVPYNNNLNSFEIINGFSCENSNVQKTYGKQINKIMHEYAKVIVQCINKNIEYLKKKSEKINKITYIPINTLTEKIINLTQINNDSNFVIYRDDYIIDNGYKYTQAWLLINTLKYQDIDKDKIECVEYLNQKELKLLNKGE